MTELFTETPEINVDPQKNYLEELVGEGKKFKTPEDLARGKYEADLFIQTKNAAYDKLREDYLKLHEEYKTQAKLAELVDKLQTQPNTREDTQNTDQPKFDPKLVDDRVSSMFQEYEAKKTREQNLKLVQDELQKKFGTSYQSVLKSQMDNLGLTKDFVEDLAGKHPQVLLKTLGVYDQGPQETFQTPPRSTVRNDNFAPHTPKRDWAYYEKLRVEKPALYHDPKTQVQMHKDAIADPVGFGLN